MWCDVQWGRARIGRRRSGSLNRSGEDSHLLKANRRARAAPHGRSFDPWIRSTGPTSITCSSRRTCAGWSPAPTTIQLERSRASCCRIRRPVASAASANRLRQSGKSRPGDRFLVELPGHCNVSLDRNVGLIKLGSNSSVFAGGREWLMVFFALFFRICWA
jgi:hypothetical protein